MKSPAFISYSREDSDFALRLAGDLKARGAEVWLDQLDIRPGQPWDREVERALTECSEMLVVVSAASVESQNVMDEVAFALDEGKTVIPVLQGDCKLPLRLRRLHHVDLRSDYGQGVRRLMHALSPPRPASAATVAQDTGTPVVSRTENAGLAVGAASGDPQVSTGRTKPMATNETIKVLWKPWARAWMRQPVWARLGIGVAAFGLMLGATVYLPYQIRHRASSRSSDTDTGPGVVGTLITRVNSKDGLTYVRIPSGNFMMGCSPGDNECGEEEKPAHQVTLSRGFWMGQTEVTQEAYQRVLGSNPSYLVGPKLPVVDVSWEEAAAYCTATGGRLPTEAEWEYAARAGDQHSRYGAVASVAWYEGNSPNKASEVARKAPNAWGLYDTLGNVSEWTADRYATSYPSGSAVDPHGPGAGESRVQRGGSWGSGERRARASARQENYVGPSGHSADVGFRCAVD